MGGWKLAHLSSIRAICCRPVGKLCGFAFNLRKLGRRWSRWHRYQNEDAEVHPECCVALCNNKGGHSLPWSQPSWIHQWIVVINLIGPNGSRRSTRISIHRLTLWHWEWEWLSQWRVKPRNSESTGVIDCLSSPLLQTWLHATNSQRETCAYN